MAGHFFAHCCGSFFMYVVQRKTGILYHHAAVNSETWCERHYIGGHPSFKTVNSLLSLIITWCSDKSIVVIVVIIIIIIMYLSVLEFCVVTDSQRTSNFWLGSIIQGSPFGISGVQNALDQVCIQKHEFFLDLCYSTSAPESPTITVWYIVLIWGCSVNGLSFTPLLQLK